jgi:large repetitive protein
MANKDFKVKNGIDVATPIPVSMGGTGQTSTTNTLNSLLPAQNGNANKVLQTDGTNTTWYTVPAAYTTGGMASRPASPTAGDLFFNTDKKAFEVWTGSAWVSVAVNGAVPLAPTVGTVTVSGLTASVPFTGSNDYGDSAVTTNTATAVEDATKTASSSTSPISVTGLTSSTSYTFTVTSTNAFGVSNASSASNSITTASTPGAPTSVTASDPGTDGYALVSWTAPASNGGSAITDYTVQYSSNSGSSWTTFSDGTSASTSATVTGLTLNTAYIFRVAAVNALGTGSYSDPSASFTPVAHDSGAMFPLQVITVGPAGASSVEFTSIPATFTNLQLRCLVRSDRSIGDGADLKIKFNGSSTDYAFRDLTGLGANPVQASAGTSAVAIGLQRIASDNTAAANIFAGMVIDILDYTSTSKNKTVRSLGGYDRNGGGEISLSSGLWYASPAAITSIELTTTAATEFKSYSQFALYGIKGA